MDSVQILEPRTGLGLKHVSLIIFEISLGFYQKSKAQIWAQVLIKHLKSLYKLFITFLYY